MQDEPTSFRIEDPGVRALFTEGFDTADLKDAKMLLEMLA